MKTFLMFKDRGFNLTDPLPWNEQSLTQDLELKTLFDAMALGDEFLLQVARCALFTGLNNDPDAIQYRQRVLQDCFRHSSIVGEIYRLVGPSIERQRRSFHSVIGEYAATSILLGAIDLLRLFVCILKKLKTVADEHADQFASEGFTALFAMLRQELSDEYFAIVENHLKELESRDRVLISAELGKDNKGTHYVLLKAPERQSWMRRIFDKKRSERTFSVHPEDHIGLDALSDLEKRSINPVANTLAQSAERILQFFTALATELAFYVGCLNLRDQLAQIGAPVCFPRPVACGERKHAFKELYDVCLALIMKQKPVGNDANADGKNLMIITGANRGGKSTLLRSIGLAQLMMQCGMFAPAQSFCANVCDRLFTHYKREEDVSMNSGKLDEELSRISKIVDDMTPNSMLLFNESFAATNEREGSEIAKQIVNELVDRRIKVFYVTHLFEFARGLYDNGMDNAIFLRAERQADGRRTFKLIEGEPLETSYGEDLYKRIFQADD